MATFKAIGLGIQGNEIPQTTTGTSEVSGSRTALATGAGATLGAMTAGGLLTASIVAAPIAVPLSVAAGTVSLLASLFD